MISSCSDFSAWVGTTFTRGVEVDQTAVVTTVALTKAGKIVETSTDVAAIVRAAWATVCAEVEKQEFPPL